MALGFVAGQGGGVEEASGRRWGGAVLVSSGVLLALALALPALRLRLEVGETRAWRVGVHRAAQAVDHGDLSEARRLLQTVRRGVEGPLPEDDARAELDAAAGEISALMSAQRVEPRRMEALWERLHALADAPRDRALARVSTLLQVHLALAAGVLLVALGAAFVLLRNGRSQPRSPSSREAVARLSRLLEASGQRELRYERFIASIDGVLLDLDAQDRLRWATPGAAEIFGDSESSLRGMAAEDLLRLSRPSGERLSSWRIAVGTADAVILTDQRGREISVTLDAAEDVDGRKLVLIRRAGPRHVRLRALREQADLLRAVLDDDDLVTLHVTSDRRIRALSPGGRVAFGVEGAGATLDQPWADESGLTGLVAAARRRGETARGSLTAPSGRFRARVVRLDNGGWWVRALPESGAEVEGDTREIPRAGASLTGRPRVLVIDDEVAIGRSIARALAHADVRVAGGGEEGLRLAVAEPEAWTLVLCDIGMPGIDGVRVFERLRDQAPELLARTVFITGALHTERARSFVERERPRLVEKPFEVAALRALLEEYSGRPRAAVPLAPPPPAGSRSSPSS